MKSNATINKIKGDMKALFDADIAVLQDVKTGSVEKLLNGNIEDGLKIIANFMTCVENTAALRSRYKFFLHIEYIPAEIYAALL